MEDTPPSNIIWLNAGDAIGFGDVPESIDLLLQRGVIAYRTDPAQADALFREALAADPSQLPVYFCLYKIHTYRGRLDEALAAARAGLAEAARQAGWSADCREWQVQPSLEGPCRFALYTLKALAFIHLRRDEPDEARRLLDILARTDPSGAVGWPVVAALAEGVVRG
jgi:tetratricopeptide (TPR) repeat protein